MTYLSLLQQAKADNITSEKKMWASIEQFSNDLLPLKSAHPDLYWKILRNQHAILYDRHYSAPYADYDVSKLVYINAKGHECTGPHWTREEVKEATKEMKFHSKVNDCDKYVAFNAMYADLCATMTDPEILRAAYAFYFNDKDWQPNEDNCTKIWDYMSR